MNTTVSKLLTQVYELEGLLLVVERHGEQTPAAIIEHIRQAAGQLQAIAARLRLPATASVPDEPIVAAPVDEPEPAPAKPEEQPRQESLPAHDYDADDTWQHDNGEEFHEVFTSNYVEPDRVADIPAMPLSDDEPVEVVDSQDIVENDTPLRVDEKLQRHLSKDLRRAFSLNDHYRFRRELFGGSEARMSEALDNVEDMATFEQAEDYFYGDLGWDSEAHEVNDFMNIIERHFLD